MRMIFYSRRDIRSPMQLRLPIEKGVKMKGSLFLVEGSNHLSGLNTRGSGK